MWFFKKSPYSYLINFYLFSGFALFHLSYAWENMNPYMIEERAEGNKRT